LPLIVSQYQSSLHPFATDRLWKLVSMVQFVVFQTSFTIFWWIRINYIIDLNWIYEILWFYDRLLYFMTFYQLFAGQNAEAIKTELLSILNFSGFCFLFFCIYCILLEFVELNAHFCIPKHPSGHLAEFCSHVAESSRF
jgi:hypothetical protein